MVGTEINYGRHRHNLNKPSGVAGDLDHLRDFVVPLSCIDRGEFSQGCFLITTYYPPLLSPARLRGY